jgi:hypothetical protein
MAGRLVTGTLAARGARSPDALAAFITQRYRAGGTIGLAANEEFGGQGAGMSTCPRCGYSGSSSSFSGGSSEALRTPAPSTGYVREGAPLTVRGGGSAPGLANPDGGISLASPRYPVTGAADLLVSNRPEGGAVIRHRRGGTEIGSIINDGAWKAVYGGKALKGHPHQRGALAELLGLWNAGTTTLQHEGEPLQPAPQQTELMQQYGIPAIRALASPSVGVSDGPRTTTSSAGSDDDDDDDSGGMSPRAASVYRKLVDKGWDRAKAKRFAANADRFGGKS